MLNKNYNNTMNQQREKYGRKPRSEHRRKLANKTVAFFETEPQTKDFVDVKRGVMEDMVLEEQLGSTVIEEGKTKTRHKTQKRQTHKTQTQEKNHKIQRRQRQYDDKTSQDKTRTRQGKYKTIA